MSILYHWQSSNYSKDAKFGFGYHLNQGNPLMQTLQPGDSVWAFTRNKSKQYVFAAELIVRACTSNPPNYRYGAYRIWADTQHSRYFDIENSPDAEPVIRALSIKMSNRHTLGISFQGHAAVRPLMTKDHQFLAQFAKNLPVLGKVAFDSEDLIEAKLIHNGEAGLDEWLKTDDESRDASRRKSLYESLNIKRSQKLAREIRDLYKGKCQICGFDPQDEYGFHLCHVHHIIWLSRGGEDDISNLCLICPTHHSAVHIGDAMFDFESLTFTYPGGHSEKLHINEHLL
jgi:hypothetical protein